MQRPKVEVRNEAKLKVLRIEVQNNGRYQGVTKTARKVETCLTEDFAHSRRWYLSGKRATPGDLEVHIVPLNLHENIFKSKKKNEYSDLLRRSVKCNGKISNNTIGLSNSANQI